LEALKAFALVWLAACGRLAFDPRAGDAAAPDDAPANCLGTGTFSAITPVAAVNDPDKQYGSFITPDGLGFYYDQPGNGVERLFFTTRPDRHSAFGPGQPVLGVGIGANDGDASITADGLELFFDSDRGGSHCPWRATRSAFIAPFDTPVRQDQLCTSGEFVGPQISADGMTLVYNSSLDQMTEGDLYLSFRTDRAAPFPAGTRLAGLPANIGFPALSKDRLRIWFEHDLGSSLEIMTAQRISPSDDFSQVRTVSELNFGDTQGDISLTLDEAEVGFSSSTAGNFDVFTATRPCL
jgi:hypothetical protein